MPDTPTVCIVDDDSGVRDSLALLIKSIGLPFKTFESATDFLDSGSASQPGCVILDIRLPGMSGLELQAELHRLNLSIPIIFITGHGDMPIAVRAIKAGALDCFAKPFCAQDLLDRVNQAIRLDEKRRNDSTLQIELAMRAASLSDREREVFDRVSIGMTNQMIAAEFGTSKKTIDVQRANMMQKMKAETLADLVQISLILKQKEEPFQIRTK